MCVKLILVTCAVVSVISLQCSLSIVNENRLTLSDPESTGKDYINASFVGVRTHSLRGSLL